MQPVPKWNWLFFKKNLSYELISMRSYFTENTNFCSLSHFQSFDGWLKFMHLHPYGNITCACTQPIRIAASVLMNTRRLSTISRIVFEHPERFYQSTAVKLTIQQFDWPKFWKTSTISESLDKNFGPNPIHLTSKHNKVYSQRFEKLFHCLVQLNY